MRFIPYEIHNGQENMKIDEMLLNEAINNKIQEPIFRLYGWEPACVSLGRNQDDKFLDKDKLSRLRIDTVRRLTGGRALLHADEITYSFICPVSFLKNGEHVITSYKEICKILIEGFNRLGIELNFGGEKAVKTGFDYCMLISTGADLCCYGKKLIGSAQCRKEGYILQHGSILYDYNKELLEEIFEEEINASEIISIREIAPTLTKEEIIKTLSCPNCLTM